MLQSRQLHFFVFAKRQKIAETAFANGKNVKIAVLTRKKCRFWCEFVYIRFFFENRKTFFFAMKLCR